MKLICLIATIIERPAGQSKVLYYHTYLRSLVQPRSQGLSSLPPLVVGRKTLVAAGHMTTQNLGGKKVCWVGGVAEYFIWLM